ncbi:MAG: 16S rRNA (guanine527-N7)-methyltransferase [Urechidicola sp.]|jgi:16S rRNA (guanine527-N7)-methyltransferase|tara:strand:+ start:10102 stop:10728 length:627 start_codon:yes stop_codon:yes gene_type:complete
MDFEQILHYFPNLNPIQVKQLQELKPLYEEWNAQINVISRKDMDNFYERHVLHSLAIAKVLNFKPNTRILDVGTGGGFPGIPLAIIFPKCHFHLVDSIGKKIKVVNGVAKSLGLKNVKGSHINAKQINDKYDFVVSRAVTRLDPFIDWIKANFNKKGFNELPNGILYLKGGDLTEELNEIRKKYTSYPISSYFAEDFFETKKVIQVVI